MSVAPAPGPHGPDDPDDPALPSSDARRPAERARVAPIAAVLARVVTLVNHGAFEDAAELYTHDAVLFDARGATYLGRGGAMSLLALPNACGAGQVELRLHRVEILHATASAFGAFTLRGEVEAAGTEGTLDVDLRRDAEGWRIHRQVVRLGA